MTIQQQIPSVAPIKKQPQKTNRSWKLLESIQPVLNVNLQEKRLDPSKLEIIQSHSPKTVLIPQELQFGKTFTGKMI